MVDEAFAYRLPEGVDDLHAAPLLCSGIVGYRSYRRAELPPGGRLGIYGYWGSAHLIAQVAVAEGARVHVLTRAQPARQLALRLGATSVGDPREGPPELLDAAILFAPAGELVPLALRALDRGGTLVIAGIHLSGIPALDYAGELFQERQLRSVTANTRADGEEFLTLAAAMRIRPEIRSRPLERAAETLADLDGSRLTGAAVLVP